MSATRIAEMLLESGLDAVEMADVVDVLAPLADLVDEVPAPSAELAALLGPARGPANVVSSLLGRRRSAVAGALVLALSGVGATGLSAAANTLPAPLQHQVSKFSRHYLPFDLPEPPVSPEHVDPFGAQLPHGSTDLERLGLDVASRSAQPREGDPASGVSADDWAAPDAPVQPRPSVGPSLAGPSATASAQPSAGPSSSPTPSSSPSSAAAEGGVAMPTSKGHPDKTPPPDRNGGKQPDKDKGKDKPDNGKDKQDKGKDKPGGQGQGPGGNPHEDNAQDPGQNAGQDQGGGTKETSPVPDLPVPSIPLPDPVPGLDAIVDAATGGGN